MQATGKAIVDHGVLQNFHGGGVDVHGSSYDGYVTSLHHMRQVYSQLTF